MRAEYESAEEDNGDHARALAQLASAAFAASPPKPPKPPPAGLFELLRSGREPCAASLPAGGARAATSAVSARTAAAFRR